MAYIQLKVSSHLSPRKYQTLHVHCITQLLCTHTAQTFLLEGFWHFSDQNGALHFKNYIKLEKNVFNIGTYYLRSAQWQTVWLEAQSGLWSFLECLPSKLWTSEKFAFMFSWNLGCIPGGRGLDETLQPLPQKRLPLHARMLSWAM